MLSLIICAGVFAAVQEERQRGRERGENEVESTSSFNEDMPVDKILDAELAVESKTETYTDGSPGNSVRVTDAERGMVPSWVETVKLFIHCFHHEANGVPNRWGGATTT